MYGFIDYCLEVSGEMYGSIAAEPSTLNPKPLEPYG